MHPDKFIKLLREGLIRPICFSDFLVHCLNLSGLPRGAVEGHTVCAENGHLELPIGLCGGGSKDFKHFCTAYSVYIAYEMHT